MKPTTYQANQTASTKGGIARLLFAGLATLIITSGCTTVERSEPSTHTTTERTVISRPVPAYTETQTIRNY